MPWKLRPCETCGTRTNKRPFARQCHGCKVPRKRQMNPKSLANLNHGQPDLTADQIETMLQRNERPRMRTTA